MTNVKQAEEYKKQFSMLMKAFAGILASTLVLILCIAAIMIFISSGNSSGIMTILMCVLALHFSTRSMIKEVVEKAKPYIDFIRTNPKNKCPWEGIDKEQK